MKPPSPTPQRNSHFRNFVKSGAFGGFVLMAASLLAFAWANSAWAPSYFALHHLPIEIGAGQWRLEKSLLHVVNDLLMAIFFLMVGLEIKRELAVGELSQPKARVLPVAAAAGGMLVPALLYAVFNAGGEGSHGWGIPMATDIAFALGVMALLGEKVPVGLKVFLTALAIVDDLGAVLVIALFYTAEIDWTSLAISLGLWSAMMIYGFRGGRRLGFYTVVGLVVWYFMLKSGVHATIAGVLVAFSVPMRRLIEPADLRNLVQTTFGGKHHLDDAQSELHVLSELVEKTQSPLHRLEHVIAPWVTLGIVPIFAFFNAGFALGALSFATPVSLGAFFGLLLGKPLGICGAAWLAVKAGWAGLPEETSWPALWGAGLLGGVGFTMSLFVAALAFRVGELGDQAKLGVFSASALAALAGLVLLHVVLPKKSRGKKGGTISRP